MTDAYTDGAVDALRRELDACVNCGDLDAPGVCDICDPGPLLSEIAGGHVSPDAIRAAVEAEREECAELCERIAREYESQGLLLGVLTGARATECRDLARLIRARGQVTV